MQTMRERWKNQDVDTGRPALVGTGEAASECGVARNTLVRWAAAGLVTPAKRTAGGHLRWDLDQLRAELAALAAAARKA